MGEPLRQIRHDAPSFFREPLNLANTFFDTSYIDDCNFINTLSVIDELLPTYFNPWKIFSIHKRQNGTPSSKVPTFQNSKLVP